MSGVREIAWKVKAQISCNVEAFILPPSSEIIVNSNLFHLSSIFIMQVVCSDKVNIIVSQWLHGFLKPISTGKYKVKY